MEYKFKRGVIGIPVDGIHIAVDSMVCGDYFIYKYDKWYCVANTETETTLFAFRQNKQARLYAGKMNDLDWQITDGIELLREYHAQALAFSERDTE